MLTPKTKTDIFHPKNPGCKNSPVFDLLPLTLYVLTAAFFIFINFMAQKHLHVTKVVKNTQSMSALHNIQVNILELTLIWPLHI